VLLVDSLVPEYGGNLQNIAALNGRVRVNIADVRDEFSMKVLIQKQDFLFNLAGQTSHWDSMQDPYTDLEINCRSQLSILEACRKHNPGVRVVYASTRQIYGIPDFLPVDENHRLHPTDVNGINKMAGEWYHILYSQVYGIRACALRLTNTYGPRMRVRDARQTFLGWWIRRTICGEEIEVYGDGKQLRDFNYVDDVVDALLIAAVRKEAYGQIFNLGASPPIALRELAALLIAVNGGGAYRIVPFPAERKKIDIGDYYGDFRRIRETLGWQPRTPLAEGLARTVAYFQQQREHYW
jgi:UDP-glucose 4-epimerase